MKQKMRNRKVSSSHCVKKSSNLLLGFARSENSDLFLYFAHSYDTKLAREAGLSSNSAGELSYFAEKFAYGGGIIYFCLPC